MKEMHFSICNLPSAIPSLPFRAHLNDRNNHFFEADAAVLEGVAVIVDVVVIVVGVAQEAIIFGEDEGGVHIRYGQACLAGVAESQYIFRVKVEVAAMLVAQVGGGLFVADHFMRRVHPYTAMVCCQHQLHFLFEFPLVFIMII